MPSIFDTDLPRNEANFAPLTPLAFIQRTAELYPERLAIVHGELRQSWGQTYARCRQLASSLRQSGIGKNDTVAVMLPNTPPMVEAHFGVPMAGAVLNALNTRLDAETIAFMLDHGEAKVVIVDPEFAPTMQKALALRQSTQPVLVIDVQDALFTGEATPIGSTTYEAYLAGGDPAFAWQLPADEWDAICLNYTSGTTGNPKGVVTHHRGAYLNAVSNVVTWTMPQHPVYLWTLPMFHCNGWCFPWTMALQAGVSVCLRRVDPHLIFPLIREQKVTHMCGAPIVYGMLVNAPAALREGIGHTVQGLIAGAAPPAAIIEGCERIGIDITHVYGLTEVYGPAAVCAKQEEWADLPIEQRAALNARQGVAYPLQQDVTVLNPETMQPVPADGETMGEIFFRGNIVMKGYLKNPTATAKAFEGGWFHTGDLAVLESDRYAKIKDRSKDVIISGGENISSIEVEDALYRHPAVVACAVVARPDPKWGETPVAYVELKPGAQVTAAEIVAHCKGLLAGYKVPREIRFEDIPKTSTGKIQKFQLRERAKSTSAIE